MQVHRHPLRVGQSVRNPKSRRYFTMRTRIAI